MTAAVRLALRQGSPEWKDARRSLVTSTDLPVLLGISPYRCEADLADEKLHGVEQPVSLRMRVGSAVQDLIGDEYTRVTGRKVRPVRGMWRHPSIEWAAASPDFTAAGHRLVEAKRTSSRSRFADGIPQDVEAQVAWALGVSGYPVADVAALVGDDDLLVMEQAADPALFADLVAIAEDFRRRLTEGGPFSRDAARIKRDHPTDDGTELIADAELDEAVRALLDARSRRVDLERSEEVLETAIKTRMADASRLVGNGWTVTWRRTKDSVTVDWRLVAEGLLREMPTDQRDTLVGLYSIARAGSRPFRVQTKGGSE